MEPRPIEPAVLLAQPIVADLDAVPISVGGGWGHGVALAGRPVPPAPLPVPGDYRGWAAVTGLPPWLPLTGWLVQDGLAGSHRLEVGPFGYKNDTFWLEWEDQMGHQDHAAFEVRLGGQDGSLISWGSAGLNEQGSALTDAGAFAAINGSIRVDAIHQVHVDARNLPVAEGVRYGAWLHEAGNWTLIGRDDGDDAFHVMHENATAGAEVIVAVEPESCIEGCSPPWHEPWVLLRGRL